MRWLSCCLLACAACSEVVAPGAPDAMSEDVPDAELAPDSVMEPCDLTQPFGAPVALTVLNTVDDDEFASLSPDELTIYFASNRAAPGTAAVDLFVATRTSRDLPFGAPVEIPTVNSPSDDRGPSISSDGLELYFHSSRSGNYDLWVATRTSTAVGFGEPVALDALNTTEIDHSPTITADGTALYFDRGDGAGTGTYDVYRATRGPTGFSNPIAVTSLGADSRWSAVSEDERTIYFSSLRAGGAGLFDVWTATRATTADAWTGVTNVAELNTTVQDTVDWISPDGCRAYVTRNEGAAFDLFVASRPTAR